MSKAATVDTKRLKQAVRRLGTAAERSASNAVKAVSYTHLTLPTT